MKKNCVKLYDMSYRRPRVNRQISYAYGSWLIVWSILWREIRNTTPSPSWKRFQKSWVNKLC